MLPQSFERRMRSLLGEEYAAFSASLDEPAVRAFRKNPLKCAEADVSECDFIMGPVPYVEGGYYIKSGAEGIGNTPEHHAGLIYIQDPGAMATVASLTELSGKRVCDLCAAPGGKTSQAAALIGDDGFILANEYISKRAKILVGNIERLGIKNSLVTSLDTEELAELYENYFDLVIADVPCSGEGMFRKNELAIAEWSEERIAQCVCRQEHILKNAARLTRPGGYLIYSTCTFSTEENELMLAKFLSEQADFQLCSVPDALISCTAPAVNCEGAPENICLARRFYPHRSLGEGQFFALLRQCLGDGEPRIHFKDSAEVPGKIESKIINDFLNDNLTQIPKGRIIKKGELFSIIPHDMPIPPRNVLCSGVLLGEIRGRLFLPAHQLFSAFGKLFKRKISLDSKTAMRYIAGEELNCDCRESGYCALIYKGAALGGGKISSGKIKNHYPKGLRHR